MHQLGGKSAQGKVSSNFSLALHELLHLCGQIKRHVKSQPVKALDIALALPEILSFRTFSTYARAIEKLLVDGIISTSRWTNFVWKWENICSLYVLVLLFSLQFSSHPSKQSTVLLAANLALLALPDVQKLTIAQVFSKASILASLGCIACAFLLMQLNWTDTQPQFNSPVNYLCSNFNSLYQS